MYQYRLSTIFLVMLLVAASLALAGGWGILLAVAVMALYSQLFDKEPKNRLWGKIGLGVAVFLGVPFLAQTLSHPPGTQDGYRRSYCRNQLQDIARALDNYHYHHHQLPPPNLCGEDGKPAHSWRVLILPYLEQQTLYGRYDFKERWNGPNNRKLSQMRPNVYRCPANRTAEDDQSGTTNYLALVGPGTAWDSLSIPNHSIAEFQPRRVTLIEVGDSKIDWLEPQDMTLDKILGESGLRISTSHRRQGVHLGMSDGTVEWVNRNALPDLWRAALSGKASESQWEQLRQVPPSFEEAAFLPSLALWFVSLVALYFHGRAGMASTDAKRQQRKGQDQTPAQESQSVTRQPSGVDIG